METPDLADLITQPMSPETDELFKLHNLSAAAIRAQCDRDHESRCRSLVEHAGRQRRCGCCSWLAPRSVSSKRESADEILAAIRAPEEQVMGSG